MMGVEHLKFRHVTHNIHTIIMLQYNPSRWGCRTREIPTCDKEINHILVGLDAHCGTQLSIASVYSTAATRRTMVVLVVPVDINVVVVDMRLSGWCSVVVVIGVAVCGAGRDGGCGCGRASN